MAREELRGIARSFGTTSRASPSPTSGASPGGTVSRGSPASSTRRPKGVLKFFLKIVIRDVVTYTEHAKRKTVSAIDVVYALMRQGRTLYGFAGSTVL